MAVRRLRTGVNLPPRMWVVDGRIWLMTWLLFYSIALTVGWVIHSHMLINALKATCTIHLSSLVSHLPKQLSTEIEETTIVWAWTCFNWVLQVRAWFCVRLTWVSKQVPPKASLVICLLYLLARNHHFSDSLLQGLLFCFAKDASLRKIIFVSLILYVCLLYVKGLVPGPWWGLKPSSQEAVPVFGLMAVFLWHLWNSCRKKHPRSGECNWVRTREGGLNLAILDKLNYYPSFGFTFLFSSNFYYDWEVIDILYFVKKKRKNLVQARSFRFQDSHLSRIDYCKA